MDDKPVFEWGFELTPSLLVCAMIAIPVTLWLLTLTLDPASYAPPLFGGYGGGPFSGIPPWLMIGGTLFAFLSVLWGVGTTMIATSQNRPILRVDAQGVTKFNWLGRRKQFTWSEIRAVEYLPWSRYSGPRVKFYANTASGSEGMTVHLISGDLSRDSVAGAIRHYRPDLPVRL